MDVETGEKIINFTRNNEPFDLTGCKVLLGFDFVAADTSKIIDSEDGSVVIEDAEAGQCSVILPNHLYEYSGEVLVHVYIILEDGRSLDAGVIVTHFEESWLDRDLEEMSQFYVERFEDLWRRLQTDADELHDGLIAHLADIRRDVDQTRSEINGALVEVRDQLNAVQTDVSEMRTEANRIIDDLASADITGHVNNQEVHLTGDNRETLFGQPSSHTLNSSSTIENTREGVLINRNLEGRTLVNLWSDRREDFASLTDRVTFQGNVVTVNSTANNDTSVRLRADIFVPGRIYTVAVNIIRNSNNNLIRVLDGHSGHIFNNWGAGSISSGFVMRSVSTRNPFPESHQHFRMWIGHNVEGVSTPIDMQFQMAILEGERTEAEMRQAFEVSPRQLAGVGDGVDELDITTVGEQLFDGKWELGTINDVTGNNQGTVGRIRTKNYIPVIGGRNIRLIAQGIGTNQVVGVLQYDKNKQRIRHNYSTNLNLNSVTRYIRVRFGGGGSVLNPNWETEAVMSISYDHPIDPTTPHQSTSTTVEYDDNGEWKTPILRSINDGDRVLVADEITEAEYIQRVVEVDLSTTRVWQGSVVNFPPGFVLYQILAPSDGTWQGSSSLEVISNKLSTLSVVNVNTTGSAISLGTNNTRITITLPTTVVADPLSADQIRQYLIDNDYQFLVPLATPHRFPIRMRSLSSFNPTTNVMVNSGAVQPRFSFDIAGSLTSRIGVAEDRISTNERDIRELQNVDHTVDWDGVQNKPTEFPSTSHQHNASDINAGTLNIARIPTGTGANQVATGNHSHTINQINGGITQALANEADLNTAFTAGFYRVLDAVNRPANAVGRWSYLQVMPAGTTQAMQLFWTFDRPDEQWIRSSNSSGVWGTWQRVRGDWENLANRPATFPPATHSHAWDAITGRPSTFAPSTHNHAGENITSGTVPFARLPVGTTATTMARGDHVHATTGTFSPRLMLNNTIVAGTYGSMNTGKFRADGNQVVVSGRLHVTYTPSQFADAFHATGQGWGAFVGMQLPFVPVAGEGATWIHNGQRTPFALNNEHISAMSLWIAQGWANAIIMGTSMRRSNVVTTVNEMGQSRVFTAENVAQQGTIDFTFTATYFIT